MRRGPTGRRITCPLCARKVVLTRASNMHPHKRETGGEWCPGSSRSTLDATTILAHELAQRGQP